MSKATYELGKLVGQTKAFVLQSPLNFAVSVVFATLYCLALWVFCYRSGFPLGGVVPDPPYMRIPFFGSPSDWSQDQTGLAVVLMTITWIGAVKIAANKR